MEVYGNEESDGLAAGELPPGFRFHPTDEEIVLHYLIKKVMDQRFVAIAIGEADLNKCEPWDLPKKAKMGENEWFFFCQKDRKYPTGMRTNRATESGYWKATGKDKEIYKDKNCMVGMKKTLVFYKGRAPKGEKTNWVIHEYRLEGNFSGHSFSRTAKDEWVVCKVFDKSTGIRRLNPGVELTRMDSFMDHLLDVPPLTDYSCSNEKPTSNFATIEDKFKGNIISSSRLTLNNHKLQMLQHGQKNFFVPPQNNYNFNINNPFSSPHNPEQTPIFCPQITIPNSVFPYQASSSHSLGYQNQVGLSWAISSFPTTNLPFKGVDQASLKLMAPQIGIPEPNKMCKMEQFSSNNSINVSHSQDTGLSSEMANEITSVVHSMGDIENKKIFVEELEGLAFSPNISDLDSLWSY